MIQDPRGSAYNSTVSWKLNGSMLCVCVCARVGFVGEAALLNRTFAKQLATRLDSVWTPTDCKTNGYAWRGKDVAWQVEVRVAVSPSCPEPDYRQRC